MIEDDRRGLQSGGENNKVRLNDRVNMELIEDWFDHLEIGEDLLKIKILEKSQIVRDG